MVTSVITRALLSIGCLVLLLSCSTNDNSLNDSVAPDKEAVAANDESSAYTHLSDEELSEIEKWANSPEHLEASLSDDGFLQNGIDAVISSSPHDLLSLDDLPPDLQEFILSELEKEESSGYAEVSEFEASEIVDITEYIIGNDVTEANLIFKIAALPDIILKKYKYIGYTHPNYSINTDVVSMSNGTLRRVFSEPGTGKLLIVEQSVQTGGNGSTLLKEAVNASVYNLPARFGLKKSESDREFASLNWNTENQSFILYQITDLENAQATLIEIGEAITENLH